MTAPRHLGRFRLLRQLGQGAQATVWLAHDPRLDREVALKLFHPAANAQAVSHWMREAHAVSRLTHPHIVPVFEAGEPAEPPFLVFEFVAGQTLAAARRQQPQWPPRDAVALLLDVLSALAAAHEQGIVHRDLKPSNVLLGADGRARVMDFGIAARVAGGARDPDRSGEGLGADAGHIVGTPGYMSPEAARGEPPLPAMDVFGAGIMLAELLAGAPPLQETDPWRAVQRVQCEDLALAPEAPVDEALRAIVQRALARDIALRYESATAFHTALDAWLRPSAPADTTAPAASGGDGHATLQFLLRRMRHKTDFPALSAQVARILRLTGSETESLNRLAEEILQDVGLTHKLLRLVNAAHFTSAAGGGIGTVSRAVALVGIAGIRNLVLSALLLEHMGDKAHAVRIQQEFLRALMAGTLARELAPSGRESEEAFLVGMLQNLGRLLTEYYFPDEALQIRCQMDSDVGTHGMEAAARRVLGIGFDDLTAGVARAWGLPARLRRALAAPEAGVPAANADKASGTEATIERLRRLGCSANELTDAWLANDVDAQADALAAAAQRQAAALGCSADAVMAAAHGARVRLRQFVQALGLKGLGQAGARRLLGVAERPERAVAADYRPTEALSAPRPRPASPVGSLLQHGLDELRAASGANGPGRTELLQRVLVTMRRALDLRCAVLCLRESGSGQLTGRLGVGVGADEARAAFRVTTDRAAGGDLFALICAKGADLLVDDAARLSSRLPSWYRQSVNAQTFLLLPMMEAGQAVGLIYGDKTVAGSLVLTDAELALLRALRDHAVVALRRG